MALSLTDSTNGVGPQCPTCGSNWTSVASTFSDSGRKIRIRKCRLCASRFTTVETTSQDNFWAILRGPSHV